MNPYWGGGFVLPSGLVHRGADGWGQVAFPGETRVGMDEMGACESAGALEGGIAIEGLRCVAVRNRTASCRRCVEACGSGCLSVGEAGPRIDAARCTSCGACATVCPTGALMTRNPSDEVLAARATRAMEAGAGRVRIACECAPTPAEDDGECPLNRDAPLVRVVCLGRIDASLLVRLVAWGAREVTLVAGPCASCPRRAGHASAQTACEAAGALLSAWGSPVVPRLVSTPASQASAPVPEALPLTPATPASPSPESPAPAAPLTSSSTPPAPDEGSSVRVHVMADGTLPHFVPERQERLLDALFELGDPSVDRVQTPLVGRVEIDPVRCTSCQRCTVFCPTGALMRLDDPDGTPTIGHRAADCVACGLCADVCRTKALRVEREVSTRDLIEGRIERHRLPRRPYERGKAHTMMHVMRDVLGIEQVYEK